MEYHWSANQSAGSRRTKKLLAKTQWFRGKEQDQQKSTAATATSRERVAGQEENKQMGKKDAKAKVTTQRGKQVWNTTVLFVEFSKGGNLQKSMREVLDRLKPMLGFGVRVT